MSRIFTVSVDERKHIDDPDDFCGQIISPEAAAEVLRIIAQDIEVYDVRNGKLVHPDD